ncbi:MAG: hypothetical protein HUJ63_10810, partial [Enterococcus sp.]|nr:hypothetical protein [Enterococcus sp.]
MSTKVECLKRIADTLAGHTICTDEDDTIVKVLSKIEISIPEPQPVEDCAYYDTETTTLYFYGGQNAELEAKVQAGTAFKYSWADTTHSVGWGDEVANHCSKIVIDTSAKNIKPISCKSWFSGFFYCSQIDGVENLDTSLCNDMSYMFYRFSYSATTPPTLDLSGWDTS